MQLTSMLLAAAVLGVSTATRGIHALEHHPALLPRQFKAPTYEGCFSTTGGMNKNLTWQWNTQGWCSEQCAPLGFKVAALEGVDCLCGDDLPASGDKVDDSKCSTPCPGWPDNQCGGPNVFSVWLTGLDDDAVGTSSSSSSSSSGSAIASSTTNASPSVVTVVGGQTMTVTAGATSTGQPKSGGGGGASKAGIAAGVVVGLVVLGAAGAGGYFFWRRKQKRELLEEHQKAAVNDFIANGRSPAMSAAGVSFDSHLDPSIMASNRMSNGSLADNADYSRRILKVTNA